MYMDDSAGILFKTLRQIFSRSCFDQGIQRPPNMVCIVGGELLQETAAQSVELGRLLKFAACLRASCHPNEHHHEGTTEHPVQARCQSCSCSFHNPWCTSAEPSNAVKSTLLDFYGQRLKTT